MRAKDNSMLIEQNYKPDPEWGSGRTAIYLGGSDLQLLVSMGVSNRFDPEKTSQDCMAAAPSQRLNMEFILDVLVRILLYLMEL